jgi:hypothetical protein
MEAVVQVNSLQFRSDIGGSSSTMQQQGLHIAAQWVQRCVTTMLSGKHYTAALGVRGVWG